MEKKLLKALRSRISSERGSIEASMVIFPLVLLFLIGMQLAVGAHTRNVEKMLAQDAASVRAINGKFLEGDRFIHIESSSESQNLDLLLSHRERKLSALIPSLSAILGRSPSVSVEGIAIVENQR